MDTIADNDFWGRSKMHRRTALRTLMATAAIRPMTVAAQSYPTRPIRLVVPLPSGSGSDVVARALAASVAQSIGQPVVVENKAGADGVIAGIEVKRSPTDGYTLLFGTNSPMMAGPAMADPAPYDPVRDFTPIVDLGRYTYLFVAHPGVPARNLEELIAYLRANPGKINYATGQTTGIMACADFLRLTGTRMVHVPYKGEPQAMLDLLSGQVQFMLATAGAAIPHIREGKLRPLAVGLRQRIAVIPDVPTLAEAGLPQLMVSAWVGLYGPRGLPAEVVDRLNSEFTAALSRPEVRSVLERQLFVHTGSTPQGLETFTREQYTAFKEKLRTVGSEGR